jgi:spore coat polysaccharide biosynthesis protein SpsF
MKFIATIECRLSSKRLPGKLILPLGNSTVIEFLIKRLKKIKLIDEIILATTTKKIDDSLVDIAKKNKIKFYRGSENNVLKRVYDAAKKFKADAVVQVSGDSPLTDIRLITKWIKIFKKKNIDIISELWGYLPSGISAPIIKTNALKESLKITKNKSDLEHVTKFIFSNPNLFKIYLDKPNKKETYPKLKLCIDEKSDYDLVNYIVLNNLKKNLNGINLIAYIKKNKNLLKINHKVNRKSERYHKMFVNKIRYEASN